MSPVSAAQPPSLPTGLSPSSLGTFEKCPRRFYQEKILGRRTPSSVDAELGTLVHLILEKLMQLPPERRTLDEARECARDAWRETLDVQDFIDLNLDFDAQHDFRWRAWRSIETYFRDIEDPATVDVVATEQKMNAVLNGVPVRGIIDRVDREYASLVTCDYKNGSVPDPKWPDQATDKIDQLNIYAGMMRETYGELPSRGRLLFTAHGVDYPVEFTEESVSAVGEKLKRVWEMVTADFESGIDAWEAKTSGLCPWCPFMEECPEGFAYATFRYLKGKVRQDAPGFAALAAKAHLGQNSDDSEW